MAIINLDTLGIDDSTLFGDALIDLSTLPSSIDSAEGFGFNNLTHVIKCISIESGEDWRYIIAPISIGSQESLLSSSENEYYFSGDYLGALSASQTIFGLPAPGKAVLHPDFPDVWIPGTSYNDSNDYTSFKHLFHWFFGCSVQHQLIVSAIASSESFYPLSIGNITLQSSIDTQEFFGYPNVHRVSPKPLLSTVIASNLPDFVQEDHPRFIEFIESYYEWMETHRNVSFDTQRMLDYQDIDLTIDEFSEQFFREFLSGIPRSILADKALVLKHIKEFYRAKGTEKSFQFFFRILFNLSADFYFPRVDILKASDGKWIQHLTVRVTRLSGNPTNLIAKRIRGRNNNVSAFVEQVQFVQEEYLTVYELFLNRSSITGTLEGEEMIYCDELPDFEARIHTVPLKINVTVEGLGYNVGDPVTIHGPGVGAKAIISEVGVNGEVKGVKITNFGAAYDGFTSVVFEPNIEPAQATIELGGTINYPGYFMNEDGQLSASKYIHDGYYYQQFSYLVYVDESVNRYRDALKRMVHPVGFKFFGALRDENHVVATVSLPLYKGKLALHNPVEIYLKQFPHRPTQFPQLGSYDLPDPRITWQEAIDARMKLHPAQVKRVAAIKTTENTFKLGPSYWSLQRDKFRYLPSNKLDDANYDPNQYMTSPNAEYWGDDVSGLVIRLHSQRAITQIKDFGDLSTEDIHERPWTKTNILPEVELKNSDGTGIPSAEAFGIAVLMLSVMPVGISSEEVVSSPSVQTDIISMGIESAESFGSLQLNQSLMIGGVLSSEHIGDLTISTLVRPLSIESSLILGVPTMARHVMPLGIMSTESFGDINTSFVVSPVAILSSTEFGVVLLSSYITPLTIDSLSIVESPTVARHLMPNGIISTETFGAIKVEGAVIKPASIVSSESMGLPSAIRLLSPSAILSTEAFGSFATHFLIITNSVSDGETFGEMDIYIASLSFEVTTNSLSFTVPTGTTGPSGDYEYDFQIDWGDGSPITHITSRTDPGLTHTYSSAGTYPITLFGRMSMFSCAFQNNQSNAAKITKIISAKGNIGLQEIDFRWCSITEVPEGFFDNLTELRILNWLFSDTPISELPNNLLKYNVNVTAVYGAFRCPLSEIPADLFTYNTAITTIEHLFSNQSTFGSVPSTLFENCINVTNAKSVFSYTALSTIPEDLFRYMTQITRFDLCFENCLSLTNIPAATFQYNTAVTHMHATFTRCRALTAFPTDMLRYNTLITDLSYFMKECTNAGFTALPNDFLRYNINITTLNESFRDTRLTSLPNDFLKYTTAISGHGMALAFSQSRLTTLPVDLLRYVGPIISLNRTFEQTNLTVLPDELLRYNTAVNQMESIFGSCGLLIDLGTDTFRYNTAVTNFRGALSGTSVGTTSASNPSIDPDLFRYNTNVTNFLTLFSYGRVDEIPADLFKYNTKVTTLEQLFGNGGFRALTNPIVPVDLFKYTTDVTNVGTIFGGCINLEELPTDLFRYMTQITSLTRCFWGCQNLSEIPAGLFDYNVNVAGCYETCRGCATIETIPPGLFDYNTQLLNFWNTFRNCQSLTTVPPLLFANNTLCTDFTETFSECSKLQLRGDLFYEDGNQSSRFLNQSVIFTNCFNRLYNSTADGGTAPDLWNCDFGTGTPTRTGAFAGVGNNITTLTNYNDIPTAWGATLNRQIICNGIVSEENIGDVQVWDDSLRPLGIESTEYLSVPSISPVLSPNGIVSEELWGDFITHQNILCTAIDSAFIEGDVTIVAEVLSMAIPSEEDWGTCSINLVVKTTSIISTENLPTATIKQPIMPTDIADDLELWVRTKSYTDTAGTDPAEDGENIRRLDDLSGNAHHLTNDLVNTNYLLRYTEDYLDDPYPVIDGLVRTGEGADRGIILPEASAGAFDFSTSSPFTVFVVGSVETPDLTTDQYLIGKYTYNPNHVGWLLYTPPNISKMRFWFARGLTSYMRVEYNRTLGADTNYVIIFSYDGSGSASGAKLWINGVEITDRTVVGDTLSGSFTIPRALSFLSGWASTSLPILTWRGGVMEAGVYSRDLSESERSNLFSYLLETYKSVFTIINPPSINSSEVFGDATITGGS